MPHPPGPPSDPRRFDRTVSDWIPSEPARRYQPGSHRLLPTISHHLNVLHEVGLLDRDKRGVWVYHRARTEALASLGTLIGCPEPAAAA
jgi:hypothetical protein